jgi:hypothetical protein
MNGKGKLGKAEQDRQNRNATARQPGQDCQVTIVGAKTEKPGQDTKSRTAKKGQLRENETSRTGQTERTK